MLQPAGDQGPPMEESRGAKNQLAVPTSGKRSATNGRVKIKY